MASIMQITTCSLQPHAAQITRVHQQTFTRFQLHTKLHNCHNKRRLPLLRAIRGVKEFDGSFELQPECEEQLLSFLNNPDFHRQVINECRLNDVEGLEFTGILFQPVPWTPNATKGMPKEYEEYHESPDYTVINVPPLVMFKAKCFSPSRLCAIFKHVAVQQ